MAEQDSKNATPDGGGVKAAAEAQAKARTEVPDAGLAKGDVVDARLDNRSGTDRPRRESFPAVPQHVDGPDLMHQAEFTKAYLAVAESSVEDGSRKGLHSPGPHGLGEESERAGKTDDTGDIATMKKAVKDGYDSRRHSG